MRLFLAIEIPPAVRDRIRAWGEAARQAGDGWRWVRPDDAHLTLRFLGEVDRSRLEPLLATTAAAAALAIRCTFRVGGLGTFPPSGRPRVLWVGAFATRPDGALDVLASRMEAAVREAGFAAETRPFHAHVTLARAVRTGRPRSPSGRGAEDLGEVAADHVALVRSELGPAGARYRRVERFPVGSPAPAGER